MLCRMPQPGVRWGQGKTKVAVAARSCALRLQPIVVHRVQYTIGRTAAGPASAPALAHTAGRGPRHPADPADPAPRPS